MGGFNVLCVLCCSLRSACRVLRELAFGSLPPSPCCAWSFGCSTAHTAHRVACYHCWMHSGAKFDRGWGLKTGPSVPKCSLGRSPHRPREASIVHTVRLAERHPTAQAASCWTKLERRAESVESPNFVRRRQQKFRFKYLISSKCPDVRN